MWASLVQEESDMVASYKHLYQCSKKRTKIHQGKALNARVLNRQATEATDSFLDNSKTEQLRKNH